MARPSARAATSNPKMPNATWLTKAAEAAIDQGNIVKAAVLYRGAVALTGDNPKLMYRLAQVYRMSGQFVEASETFRRFIKISKDAKKIAAAQTAIKAMASMPAPFVDSDLAAHASARTFGVKAFTLGLKATRRHRYHTSIKYFQAALMLDPTLVGALRWIGQVYAKLHETKQAQAYYVRYLRVMPGGKNAREVRKRLKNSPVLGKLTLTASFPCEVWINRAPLVGKKTPIKQLLVPEGEYSVIFYYRRYHVGRKMRVFVKRGQVTKRNFGIGVLIVKLTPWARIRVDGRDVGLWNEIGIPARAKPYKVEFRSYDGKKSMIRLITVTPGRKLNIARWK